VKVFAMLALAGCAGVESIDGTWEPVETITGVLAPELGGAPASVAPPADGVLRLATWNVYRAPDPEMLTRELQESPTLSRADVLLVQELEQHDGEVTRARRLAEAIGMTWVYAPARTEPGYTHGIAIMSRYPIANARVMRLPLGRAGWHENPRNALAAEIELGPWTLTVVDVHLDVRIGPVDRIRQLHPVVMQIPEAVAIGGDWNTNPWAWVEATVPLTSTEAIVGQDQASVIDDYMTGLGFSVPLGPHEVTFNKPLLDHMRLDIVYPRGYAVLGGGIATDVGGSDHWPVWLDVQLPQ
jgi:endonuclease/exonuclease/phosphatase family metal-dependent hydrolase